MRERKERIKNDRRIFGLGYCKFGVTINKMGILEVKETGKDFLLVRLKCPSDVQVEMLIRLLAL